MLADASFLAPEERCGYPVSAQMKRVWAVELELLAELQRVCREAGLVCFAGGGTLLGAVRHGGFIPWDDDIDMCMLRSDYDRLLAIGPTAFRPPFFFQTPSTDRRYSRGHIQLRYDGTTAMRPSEGTKFPFHQGIFIDIFPLDRVPDDPKRFAALRRRLVLCDRLLNASVRYPASEHKTLWKTAAHALLLPLPWRAVRRRLETLARTGGCAADSRVAPLTFLPGEDAQLFPAACFASMETVPFEYLQISIPTGYDTLLRIQYGDYTTPRRAPSLHGELWLDPDLDFRIARQRAKKSTNKHRGD